jgi:transposase-like protein
MSERAAPFYCPYCGEEDLEPYDAGPGDGAGWYCRGCARAFKLKFLGIGSVSK